MIISLKIPEVKNKYYNVGLIESRGGGPVEGSHYKKSGVTKGVSHTTKKWTNAAYEVSVYHNVTLSGDG